MRLTDQRLIELFRDVLGNDARGVGGYVRWKKVPAEWVSKNLDGQTQRSIAQAMLDYVDAGGEIDQTRETRPEYSSQFEFHYDFRFRIDGIDIYIETVLVETKTGPEIIIVSFHLK